MFLNKQMVHQIYTENLQVFLIFVCSFRAFWLYYASIIYEFNMCFFGTSSLLFDFILDLNFPCSQCRVYICNLTPMCQITNNYYHVVHSKLYALLLLLLKFLIRQSLTHFIGINFIYLFIYNNHRSLQTLHFSQFMKKKPSFRIEIYIQSLENFRKNFLESVLSSRPYIACIIHAYISSNMNNKFCQISTLIYMLFSTYRKA